MGCHSSRLYHQNEEMQPKLLLPPLLSRKLEEIRSRRAAGTTLSKKELLKDGYEDDSVSGHHRINDRKSSVSSPERDDDNSVGGYAKVAPQPTDPKEIFCDNKKVIIDPNKSTNQDNDNAEDDEAEAPVATTLEKQALEQKQVEQHKVEEYEKFSPLHCPGSPSFRFYLHLNEPVQDIKEDDHGKDIDSMSKGSMSDTDVHNAEIAESPTSIEESKLKIKKRPARIGMRLRKAIPTGKRNFLSVVSCYNPSSVSQQTPAKPATT